MSLQCLIDHPKELLELIDSCLKPKKLEKEQFGEVFTPIYLINEMLDKLPLNVWSNRDLKWFDPATGMGNFPIAVYLRLMEGLKQEIPIEEVRKKHILENMLYMSELNQKNEFIIHQIFNINSVYSLNVSKGNTLDLDTKQKWNIENFDIVMGNPPYNKSKDGVLKGGYGGRSLWDKFVKKALDTWVKKDTGLLLFIHPPSWRKPKHYLWDIISKKQLLYLKQYSKKEGLKIFGCSTLVDYYVLENINLYKDTVIDAQDKKTYNVNLKEWDFLPSGCIDEIKRILGRNEVIYSSSIYDTRKKYISLNKKEDYSMQVVHTMTKKDGLGFVYSKEDKGHFNVPKVILSFGEFQYPYNDWTGEYGMSQICYGLPITSKEEGDKIVEAIISDKFKEILKYTKWSTFQTDWRMFNNFHKDFWLEFTLNEPIVDKKVERVLDPKIILIKRKRVVSKVVEESV